MKVTDDLLLKPGDVIDYLKAKFPHMFGGNDKPWCALQVQKHCEYFQMPVVQNLLQFQISKVRKAGCLLPQEVEAKIDNLVRQGEIMRVVHRGKAKFRTHTTPADGLERGGNEVLIGTSDQEAVKKILDALSSGLRRVEAEAEDGRRVTGYYVTSKRIRIDIVDGGKK